MEQKIIEAALEEIQIHAMKFTMEDLTRRLHISKTSLYKMVPSKDALVQAIIDRKISAFRKNEEDVLRSDNNADEKLMRLVHLYTDAFGIMGSHIASDLQGMYPKIWSQWQEFQRERVRTVMELIRAGIETGVYRPVSLPIAEASLTASIAAVSDPAFLHRHDVSYRDTIEALGDLILYGLKKR